jgi:hypothetical protein
VQFQILNLGTRWLHAPVAYIQEKGLWYPLDRRLGGASLDAGKKIKISCLCLE